jgi:hypothetical protein
LAAAGRWSDGHCGEALPLAELAYRYFLDQCIGVPWDRAIARFYVLHCQLLGGHLKELVADLSDHLADAQSRGDIYTQLYLRTLFIPQQLLMEDRPRDVMLELDQAQALRRDDRFQMHHWWSLSSEAQRLLYDQRGLEADELVRGRWRRLRGSLLLMVPSVRVEAILLRGRCAVAAAMAEPKRRRRHLAHARADARRLSRVQWDYAQAFGRMLEGAIAAAEGDQQEAIAALTEAEQRLRDGDIRVHAEACLRSRGRLAGGDDGAAQVAAADATLTGMGVMNPAAYVRACLPFDSPATSLV